MEIDAKKIEELRGLLAKATPGPWEVRYSPRTTEECIVVGPRPETMGYAPCILAEDYTGFGEWPVREADHLLVAAMRNTLPTLLDLIERAVPAAAEARSAALARALEELNAKVDAFWNDPERPSVHRMRSKSVHELSDAQRRARSLLAPKEDTDANGGR